MRFIAIDWSGRQKNECKYVWIAEADSKGRLVSVESGRSRLGIAAYLVALAKSEGQIIVGLDFAFSFPAHFLRARKLKTASDLWKLVEAQGEKWLSECRPPFWGRPGRPDPRSKWVFRLTELQIRNLGTGSPKSVFQIGGAGAVGTGSIRGIPLLTILSEAGYSIWPFEPPNGRVVIEIFPRLYTQSVTKTNKEERKSFLEKHYNQTRRSIFEKAISTDDAFDASVSALAMAKNAESLCALKRSTDPIELLEGLIWRP